MFDFKDVEQKIEQLAKHVQQANEFWFNAIISSFKNFQSKK